MKKFALLGAGLLVVLCLGTLQSEAADLPVIPAPVYHAAPQKVEWVQEFDVCQYTNVEGEQRNNCMPFLFTPFTFCGGELIVWGGACTEKVVTVCQTPPAEHHHHHYKHHHYPHHHYVHHYKHYHHEWHKYAKHHHYAHHHHYKPYHHAWHHYSNHHPHWYGHHHYYAGHHGHHIGGSWHNGRYAHGGKTTTSVSVKHVGASGMFAGYVASGVGCSAVTLIIDAKTVGPANYDGELSYPQVYGTVGGCFIPIVGGAIGQAAGAGIDKCTTPGAVNYSPGPGSVKTAEEMNADYFRKYCPVVKYQPWHRVHARLK